MNILQKAVAVAVQAVDGNAYVASRRRIIDTWDFTNVKKRLIIDGVVKTMEEADAMEAEYRKFHSLILLCPDLSIPIGNGVDPFWHTHIIFTRDYMEFTEQVHNKYLHHVPAILESQEVLDELFEKNTLPMYSKFFGIPSPLVWGSACCRY